MVRNQTVTVIITANGEGSRMKGISPAPKHLLYYGGKRIVDHIRDCFPKEWPVKVLTRYDTPGHDVIKCGVTRDRAQTLQAIADMQNALVVDCDVIPICDFEKIFKNLNPPATIPEEDCIFCFEGGGPKYCGVWEGEGGELARAEERADSATLRASGVYFLKKVRETLEKMKDPNSIASAMIGANIFCEKRFIRLGDPEDYMKAVASLTKKDLQ